MFTLTGHLAFAPPRPGFKKAHKLNTLMLELERATGACLFYNQLIKNNLGPWVNLQLPMWRSHVTVAKGTERFDQAIASRFAGRRAVVTAHPCSLQRTAFSGSKPAFWFINVSSPELADLRSELSLPQIQSFHLTVSRENPGFFMHAAQDGDAHELCAQALALTPTGMTDLRLALTQFYKLPRSLKTYKQLMLLVHKFLSHPSKSWELQVVHLFKIKDDEYAKLTA